MVNVQVQGSIVGGRLYKSATSTGKNKKNMKAQPRFKNLHLNKPQDFWNYDIWTDATKKKLF